MYIAYSRLKGFIAIKNYTCTVFIKCDSKSGLWNENVTES